MQIQEFYFEIINWTVDFTLTFPEQVPVYEMGWWNAFQ